MRPGGWRVIGAKGHKRALAKTGHIKKQRFCAVFLRALFLQHHFPFEVDSRFSGNVDIGPNVQGIPVLYMDDGDAIIFLPVYHEYMVRHFHGGVVHGVFISFAFPIGLGEGESFIVVEIEVKGAGRHEIHQYVMPYAGVQVFPLP